ncbi:MAG TPA: sugar phosphate isomerase/epimerase family protein [Pseudonocardiaceae bacterium]
MWTLSGFADEISPDPAEQSRVLCDLGVNFLEFRSAWGTNVLDLDDEELDRAAKILAGNGLRISSVGSPIGKIGIHDDFDDHLGRFDRALRVADVLGAPYIRIFSFWMPEDDDPGIHRDEVLRRISELVRRAAGHDVILVHENEKRIYGDIPERCKDIVESIGSPMLRLVWDPANFVQCGVRPFTRGYQQLRSYVEYLHIKDAMMATGAVVPAGAGDGELVPTIRALRADGFDGFLSLEPHLALGEDFGGFSGPKLFGTAHGAFATMLDNENIEYR